MPALAPFVGKSTVALSIMAGKSIAFLQAALPAGTAIVRAITDTLTPIGRNITVTIANAMWIVRQRKLASILLSAIGKVEWASNETLMDAVTALSGSGPAHVFFLAHTVARA